MLLVDRRRKDGRATRDVQENQETPAVNEYAHGLPQKVSLGRKKDSSQE